MYYTCLCKLKIVRFENVIRVGEMRPGGVAVLENYYSYAVKIIAFSQVKSFYRAINFENFSQYYSNIIPREKQRKSADERHDNTRRE